MLINIDPTELGTAATTLRSASVETADVGAQLTSCVGCQMPAEVRNVVDQLVATADRVLDATAAHLAVLANDLSNRAGIATNDSLITVGVNPNLDAPMFAPGTAFVGGGWGSSDFTIVGPDGTPADLAAALGNVTIGGTMTLDPGMGLDMGTFGLGTAVIGGGSYSGMAGGIMALAEAGQTMREKTQRDINAILSNPSSSMFAQKLAMNAQDSLGYDINHLLAPSETELEDKYGPLTDSAIKSLSPYTPENTISLLDGISPLDMFALSLQ